MSFFDHRHHWRPKMDTCKVMSHENPKLSKSILVVEDCHCGAVRTIEIEPGKAPEVRITLTPMYG